MPLTIHMYGDCTSYNGQIIRESVGLAIARFHCNIILCDLLNIYIIYIHALTAQCINIINVMYIIYIPHV